MARHKANKSTMSILAVVAILGLGFAFIVQPAFDKYVIIPKAKQFENWLAEQDNKTAIMLNGMTEEVKAQLQIVDMAQEDRLEIVKAFGEVIGNAKSSADLALILSSGQLQGVSGGNEQVYVVAQNAVKAGMANFNASQDRTQVICANYANWRDGNLFGMRAVSLGYPTEGVEQYCKPILNGKARDAQETRDMPNVIE